MTRSAVWRRWVPLLLVGLVSAACAQQGVPSGAGMPSVPVTTSTTAPNAPVSTMQPDTTTTLGSSTTTVAFPSRPLRTLLTLTDGIELPWRSGLWTIDEFGYPGQFAVLYDGQHQFGVFSEGEMLPLPEADEPTIAEEEVRTWCEDRVRDPAPSGLGIVLSHEIAAAEFFSQPGLLSVCTTGSADGGVEDVFVELFLHRVDDLWVQLWASNQEWDTIDPRPVAGFAPVFRQFVAAHADGTEAVDGTDRPPPGAIEDVATGKQCHDLFTMGFSYPEAVAYWMTAGSPVRWDADRDGAPCDTVYPPFAVEMVFGDPAWGEVEFVAAFDAVGVRRFVASGAAVETNVVCAGGTVQDFHAEEWGWSGVDAVGWSQASEYICDDGTGSFVIGMSDHIVDGDHVYATWTTGTTGTGAYEWLTGGGGSQSTIGPDDLREDRLFGRVAIELLG